MKDVIAAQISLELNLEVKQDFDTWLRHIEKWFIPHENWSS